MFTKKRVAVLSYICGASIASVFLMGSVCDKTPACYVGNQRFDDLTTEQCAEKNRERDIAIAAALAAQAAQNAPPPTNTPPESGMQGGMMEGGMMEGGMMEGGMMQPP